MNKQLVLRGLTVVAGCIFLLICAYPHYLRRVEEHAKHTFVLDNHCDTSRPHPSIHYNQMTYDGIQTNCSEARAYTGVPILAGAFMDLWLGSPVYGILYATDWKVQLAYVIFGCVTIMCVSYHLRKYYTDKHVIDAVEQQKRNTQMMIVKQTAATAATAATAVAMNKEKIIQQTLLSPSSSSSLLGIN